MGRRGKGIACSSGLNAAAARQRFIAAGFSFISAAEKLPVV